MGTVVQVRAFFEQRLSAEQETDVGEKLEAALALFVRLEKLMSPWLPDSEVSRINAAAGKHAVQVSVEVYDAIAQAQHYSQRSQGVFDISFHALCGLWSFDENPSQVLPDPEQVRQRLPLVNFRKIELVPGPRTVYLQQSGMAIHLGGIGKGYAVDAAVALLRSAGVLSGLVQAGGDLRLFGPAGSPPLHVGVRDPRSPDPSDFFAVCEVANHAFSTAGDYERAFLKDGRRYHHILDPRTGWPARGARSVTVYADDATTADGLDDIVLVLGPERGLALLETFPGTAALVVDENNRVWLSKSLEKLCRIVHPPSQERNAG